MGRRKKSTAAIADSNESVRCAIYTRKSTSEGLDNDFNTLDAQREACEAYIASQKHSGWVVLPDRYDDGGFSGGTIDRPAMEQLIASIEAGEIDCVVVYKVDRLSRSLLDFARLMQLFEEKKVHFVSVIQHFNTADSMGRLTLNILLSFAQFEREIIGERTRDKIAAQRRRGKWPGGWQVLGYDVDRERKTLTVNEEESKQVRGIFELYLKHESLIETARQVNLRGWTTKRWMSAKGKQMGGRRFDKSNLNYLLMNETYIGRIRHHDTSVEGLHDAIIDAEMWDRAQHLLRRNNRTKGSITRNSYHALLKGLLRCKACDAAMTHTACTRGQRQYRYYICVRAQKQGHATCPTKTVKAESIEQAVLEKMKALPLDQQRMRSNPLEQVISLMTNPAGISRKERAQVIRLVIEHVRYDRTARRIGIELTDAAKACLQSSYEERGALAHV